ncbi:MAG: Diguanylate cyclase GGDEF domain protein [Parcubacteria group bacterium GW2011_GWA2_42_14]|nr:MAG: Diguanylate cyclase GGDEF domain protein [Parcubacteria group bacterium GW2011_GWA2_42_14]
MNHIFDSSFVLHVSSFMKKILFIEDEPALQKTLSSAFTSEGFEVIQALDGETGVRLARQKKPDLLLLDLILPKMDGFEVLRQLQADPETKSIPVVVLTNLEGMGEVQKVIELGARDYLVKTNYKLDELVAKVKTSLNL